jgi:hypothetical protein
MHYKLRAEKSVPYLGGMVAAEVEIDRAHLANAETMEQHVSGLEQQIDTVVSEKLAAAGVTLDENGNRVEL